MMSNLLAGPIQSVALEADELDLARASSVSLSHRFAPHGSPVTLRFSDAGVGDEVEVTVPSGAMRMLADALAQLAEGHPVTLVPLQAELSTQQAAELMGVSRPYFVKLLEARKLPFRRVGEQRRVRYADLLRYMEDEHKSASEAFSEMTAEAQALGLYE